MKNRYEQENQRKETLDQKANNMMTIASTVATLYSGFGVAIVTQLFTIPLQMSATIIILLIGVGILIISIFLGTKAYMLREYNYAFNFKPFAKVIDKDFNIKFDDTKIENYQKREANDFGKLMVKIYTKCILQNMSTNETRGTSIIWSQRVFLVGLASFPVFILSIII